MSMNQDSGRPLSFFFRATQFEEARLITKWRPWSLQSPSCFPIVRSSFMSAKGNSWVWGRPPRGSTGTSWVAWFFILCSVVSLPKSNYPKQINSRISSENLCPPPRCLIDLLVKKSLCGSSSLLRAVSWGAHFRVPVLCNRVFFLYFLTTMPLVGRLLLKGVPGPLSIAH